MKYVLIMSFLLALVIASCVSDGPTLKIVTDKPTKHFVIVCKWYSDFSIHGGKPEAFRRILVANSGEDISCGLSPFGGKGSVSIHHPTYIIDQNNSGNNGYLVHMISALDNLRIAQDKYESGYWDTYKDPTIPYLREVRGCGVSERYLKLYNRYETPDYTEFKKLYYDATVQCMRKIEAIRHKHGKSSKSFYLDGKHLEYEPERVFRRILNAMWGSKRWARYLNGTEDVNWKYSSTK